ncbi:MAG: hypothetical protein U0271_18930 [Polyangiaceae bacterium]
MRATLALLLIAAGCARTQPAPPREEPTPQTAGESVAYAVTLESSGKLRVELRARSAAFASIIGDDGADAFVSEFTVARADDEEAARSVAVSFPVAAPECATGCVVRYVFDLRGAGRAIGDPEWAAVLGDALLGPPTTWLLRPAEDSPGEFTVELHADGAPSASFALALEELPIEPGDAPRFRGRLEDLPRAPYAAMGSLRTSRLAVDGGVVDVVHVGAVPDVGDARIDAWVREAAENVAHFTGRFAIGRALVIVVGERGDNIGKGTTLGNGGASIIVHVGTGVSEAELHDDWIMTHEMVHVSMPGLASRHAWLEEGMATFAEPVARADLGRLTPENVWSEWFHMMGKGQPQEGDGGLDGTSAWGRLYWGGAAFWLLADVGIVEATSGRRSLRDCMRHVVSLGGNVSVRWTAQRFLEACDEGAGTHVVVPLYEEMSQKPVTVDLDALFARLGVKGAFRGVSFDDAAPDASTRRHIVAGTRPQTL